MTSTNPLLDLTDRYGETHRHYHTLTHIAAMFAKAKEVGADLSEEQTIAVWYHDAVYVPGAHDNEVKSAVLAVEAMATLLLNGRPRQKSLLTVEQIILSTRDHVPLCEAAKVVIDLDLSILAAPLGDGYWTYVGDIRKEYAAATEEQWCAGRVAFLSKFLERPRLFYTEWGADMEKAARDNMEDEVKFYAMAGNRR